MKTTERNTRLRGHILRMLRHKIMTARELAAAIAVDDPELRAAAKGAKPERKWGRWVRNNLSHLVHVEESVEPVGKSPTDLRQSLYDLTEKAAGEAEAEAV